MKKRYAKIISLISAVVLASSWVTVCGESDVDLAQFNAELGTAAEAAGDFVTAGEYFERSVSYGRNAGRSDYVGTYESRALHYKPELDLYTLSPGIVQTYNAKNEPSGVLYGDISENINAQESMCVVYCDYNSPDPWYVDRVMDKSEEYGQGIELAFNFSNVGEMKAEASSLSVTKRLAKVINDHSSVPVYFRIAAEMNLWCAPSDAGEYKAAFRKIAECVRDNTENAVVVWSAFHVSAWGVTFRNYYPGDSYVDWVGISVYANKYFNGNDLPTDCKWYFAIGDFADPELSIRAAVKAYGGRKPIIITESGVAHYTQGSINQSHTSWAAARLRKLLAYIPMLYPQVKGIVYFDKRMNNELSFFDLEESELRPVYNEFTRSPWFIQNRYGNESQSFKQCGDTISSAGGRLELYAYTHIFGDAEPRVDYYIDDVPVASSETIPYKVNIDISKYTDGSHRLKAVMTGSNNVSVSKEYTLTVTR